MQTAPWNDEQAMSAVSDDTVQQWEVTYTTVDWDYPTSPAAYYDALLSRGASHSRFLRIAYSSTRERDSSFSIFPTSGSTTTLSSTTSSASSSRKSAVHLSPAPPCRPYLHVRLRSINPPPHLLKRRKPHWPKPPHYHASLLRSPLSRRKGLFRAVLPPNKAVDFFRWDILVHSRVSVSLPHQEMRVSDVYASPLRHVAESVLEPYEAAAGFFGWHGLGLDVIRRLEGRERGAEVELTRLVKHKGDLRFEVDEEAVDEGKARWARTAEELVGPPGVASRWVVKEVKSGKLALPLDPAHKNGVDARASSSTWPSLDEVRWDPDIGSSRRPSRPNSTVDKTRSLPSSSKVDRRQEVARTWWYAPSQHGQPPANHLPSLRLPPPQHSVQYGPPPIPFSPWFPGGRVTSAQGHGYWYGQPIGASPSMNRDSSHTKSLVPHPHGFPSPTFMRIPQSPRQHTKSLLGRGEHELVHDRDKETEDHDYESTTTTTDSDPPPHTPIGTTTTPHRVEPLQVHGDDEVDVDNIEIDGGHAAAAITIGMSDPTTPVKLLDRFSVSTSPSMSSTSSNSRPGSSKAVVFPSLNGSFRQGSLSRLSISSSSDKMSTQTTPARTVTPASSVSLLSGKNNQGLPKVNTEKDSSDSSSSEDALGLSSPLMSSSGGLHKDSQGFWESVSPISPSSSSSSLPLSPTERKSGPRLGAVGWIGEKKALAPGESASSSGSSTSADARSSPRSDLVNGSESTPSSSSRADSLSPPASGSASGSSHSSLTSPPEGPANPTTLLPAFLATPNVKRKKTSRTREIVDQLRSSSVDAGKGGVGLEGLGWQAGSSANGEIESPVGKGSSGSDPATMNGVTGSKPVLSPPKKDVTSGVSDLAKTQQGQGTSVKPSDPGSSASERKNGRVTSGPDTHCSHATSSETRMVNSGITPFPILTVSHPSSPQGQSGATVTSTKVGDGPRLAVATSPVRRTSGLPHLPNPPSGGTSPIAHTHHHPHPSPTRVIHALPPLGPPPAIITVSPYPPPMYVPFTQYRLGPPPHQAPQGQGTWVPIYPGRPPVPVHPLPAQPHVSPITGASGMRHVSW